MGKDMTENTSNMENLTPGAQHLIEIVIQKMHANGYSEPGFNHWLVALLERHEEMVKATAKGIDINQLHGRLKEQLLKGEFGTILTVESFIRKSVEHALARDKKQASEVDIVAIILAAGD